MNPFKYGDPVSGEFFLERSDLKKSVSTFLENKINVVLIGPRRFGKTSFILDLLHSFSDEKKYATLYVDIFNVTSHRDFLSQLVNAMAKKTGVTQKMIQWIRELPKQFSPALSLDGDVKISMSLHKSNDEDVKQLISSALESLGNLSEKVCIAFDEFQTVGDLDDGGWLEATLRSKMQSARNVSYLFSGSRHGLIQDMFNNPARPFYRSCQLVDFPPLGSDFTPWIIRRFRSANIDCDASSVDHLRHSVDDTPNYVQMVCFHIVANEVKSVNKQVVDETLDRITAQSSYPYQTILNSLTAVQTRVLRMAAFEKKAIYSKEILQKYEIKSGAHVSQAINSLVGKQILDSRTANGVVIFDDPLFAIWLRKELPRT